MLLPNSASLLHGVNKDNPTCLLVWLVYSLISIFVLAIAGCVLIGFASYFEAVVVPYHNATGANYAEVHAVAADATEGPVIGVAVDGGVRTERAASTSAVAVESRASAAA